MRRSLRQKNKGFTLTEIALSILIIGVLSSLSAVQTLREVNEIRFFGVGQQIDQHTLALQNYIFQNYADLKDPARSAVVTTNTGVPNVLQPTFVQLRAAPQQFIPPLMNIGDRTSFGQPIAYQVYRTGICPGQSCNVYGLAFPTTPFRLPNGAINDGAAITAMSAMGVRAGVAYADTPAVVRGFGGAWSEPHPLGAAAIGGMVFGLAGGNINYLNAFYRKSGDTLLGQMDAGDQNIINGQRFTFDEFIDRGNNVFSVKPSGTSTLNLVNMTNGRVADRNPNVDVSNLLPDYVRRGNGTIVYANGATVPKPVCPQGGGTQIDVQPQRVLGVDGFQINAPVSVGSNWVVTIVDSAAIPIPGATFTYRAECLYGRT